MFLEKPSLSGRFWLMGLLLVLTGGCATKSPPPLSPPAAKVEVGHLNGTVLSGPTTRSVTEPDNSSALFVQIQLISLEKNPDALLRSIGPDARLIASSGDSAVLPRTRLTQDCRWDSGDPARELESKLGSEKLGRSAPMGSFELAIPLQTTAFVRAMDTEPRGIELQLNALAGAAPKMEIGLTIQDSTMVPDGKTKGPSMRETAVLQALPVDQPIMVALLIPFEYSDHNNKTVLALLRIAPAKDQPGWTQLLDHANKELKQSAAAATNRPMNPVSDVASWPGFESALVSTKVPATRRTSLEFLATQTGALICEDMVLVADDEALAQLSATIDKRLADPALPHNGAALGWVLDAGTLDLLAWMQNGGKIAPELRSVLLRHVGQPAQNTGSIEQIVQNSANRQDLRARLTSENMAFLEDTSPAVRVRAYDWLHAWGQAPEGFDPLAPAAQRQDALEKAWDAMDAKRAAAAGGKP